MRAVIHVQFTADVEDELAAWRIVDGLEGAATRAGYIGVSSWVESGTARAGVMVPEGSKEVPVTEAERIERVSGNRVTAIGDGSEGGLTPVLPGSDLND